VTLTIRNRADDVTEVLLYGVIGADPWFGDGVSAKSFRDAVKAVKGKVLNLRINSPGGSVTEASAMLAALDEFRGGGKRVEVDIDGLAASAASVVAMAGTEVRIAQSALMMIHNPHVLTVGGADDHRRAADLLDTVKGQILDRYAHKAAGKTARDTIAAWMDAETWLSGQEAADAGLADRVTAAVNVAASFDLAKFNYRHPPQITQPTQAELDAHEKRLARAKALGIAV
jgi:ATP-dependent Clp protease protease subunit